MKRFALSKVIIGTLLLSSQGYSHGGPGGHDHGGHGHGNEAGTIEGGALKGTDGITYLDAGKSINIGKITLKQEISSKNQIIYTTDYENAKVEKPIEGKLALEIPGGEKFEEFKVNAGVLLPPVVEMESPKLDQVVQIKKSSGLKLLWKRTQESSPSVIMVRIEVLESQEKGAKVIGELNLTAKDDGAYFLTAKQLSGLPTGPARMAVRRVDLGGFARPEQTALIGVKAVSTLIAKAQVVD